jgi:SAM-dependent methyltransferase
MAILKYVRRGASRLLATVQQRGLRSSFGALRLYSQAIRKKPGGVSLPQEIQLEAANICNLHCPMCSYGRNDTGPADRSSERRPSTLVFAFDVLEHIDDPLRVVACLRQLLAEKGVFVFCVPLPVRKYLLDNYHTNMRRPEFWTNLFRQQGFELLGLEFASFFPGTWRFGLPVILRRVVERHLFASQVFFAFRKVG